MTTRSTILTSTTTTNSETQQQQQQQKQSQTRKMRSNPIPINTWQMRSRTYKLDDPSSIIQQSPYDNGSLHDCLIQNSSSPQSYQSLSSPPQSLSPIKEFTRLMKPQTQFQQSQHQQIHNNLSPFANIASVNQQQSSLLTNDDNYTLDMQTGLVSLFVNTTLNEATSNTNTQSSLSSIKTNDKHTNNQSQNDDNMEYKKCDPVLTQIALNKPRTKSNEYLYTNLNSNNDNICLSNNLKQQIKQEDNNYLNKKLNTYELPQSKSSKRSNVDDLLSFNQYSMSLPANCFNYMDISTPTELNVNQYINELDANTYQMDDLNDTDSIINNKDRQQQQQQQQQQFISTSLVSDNHPFLSISLPSYSLFDDFISHKKAKLTNGLPQATTTVTQSQSFYSSYQCQQPTNNSQINKLLNSSTNTTRNLGTFNSDSNLSSPLSTTTTATTQQNDDFKPSSSLKRTSKVGLNDYIDNDIKNGDFDADNDLDSQVGDTDDDSDDDSAMYNDGILDLMNKTRDTFFWQYNIQSKGPKTKKVLTLRNKDPHLHRDFFDPVYQLQTINARGTSLNKLRKGDGNDVTPNSEKLYNLGIQIRDFIQKSYQINNITTASPTSTSDLNVNNTNNSEKLNLKREKNKIASRACRLKKKAQHEANKLKLNGLNEEHKQLVDTINIVKDLIKKRLTAPNQLPPGSSLTNMLDEVAQQKLTLKVAGNTDSYVLALMQNVEKERTAKLLLQNQMMTSE